MRQLILISLLALLSLATKAQGTWYGYYDGSEPLSEFGTGVNESYDCAIFLPGNIGAVSGKTISKIRFSVQAPDYLENVKAWVSRTLPQNGAAATNSINVTPEMLGDGKNVTVSLNSPFAVPQSGIYVGLSFDSKDPFPLLTTSASTTQEGGMYLKTSYSYKEWKDFSQYKYGNLAIQVLIDDEVSTNAAEVAFVTEEVGLYGEEVEIIVGIRNLGLDGTKSITYSLQSDNDAPETYTYEFPVPLSQVLEIGYIPIKFKTSNSPGISYKEFTILKVNEKENENEISISSKGGVISLEKGLPRNTVMEEFTGTWCGWCPRGMVALELLKEDYGNSFVPIAVHGNDPMQINGYLDVLSMVSSFPNSALNRMITGDPYYGPRYVVGVGEPYGIKSYVEEQQEELTPALVSVNSVWNEDHSRLTVDGYLSLNYDRKDNPPYRIAYVLTADGLTGSGVDWWQSNDFAMIMAQGYKDDPYVGWLTEEPEKIKDIAYNDVAVDCFSVRFGEPLISEGTWKIGEKRKIGSHEFNISSNPLIKDKDQVYAIVFILDSVSGKIVNAARAKVGESSEAGILDTILSDSQKSIISIWDISGKKLNNPVKGINIVRYSDGTIKKIFIK